MKANRVALKSESSVITKGTTPTSLGYAFTDDGVPFLRAQNLVDGTVSVASDPMFISPETNEALKRSKIVAGDVLISIAGTIGRAAIVPKNAPEMNCNQAVAIVRPSERIHRRYLLHWLSSDDALSQMSKSKVTGVISNLSLGEIGKLQIPLPPLEEQKRIAGILDEAARLCRLRTRALDTLNTLGQAIFHEMFGEIGHEDSIELGEMLSFVTSGGRGWARYYADTGPRFIRSLDVQNNEIGNDEIVYVNPPQNAEARRTEVQTCDVLLTITGSKIGRAAPVQDALSGSYISQHVAILRPKPEKLLPYFLSYFLNMEEFGQAQIKAKQYGQAKPGLNFEQIRGFKMPNATLAEQTKFVARVQKLNTTVAHMKAQQEQQTALFASLQHRAFRGEL
ncbi:restriction endonuclease subunit S [Sedimentimonas flavescens]|uniref:restriction endonuclease subunit S n=1 Tax=Sedimentimonas flavescens TaxID=2851012 RepID=UPI0021A59764|nr:restriction endonuclease subunit S [Sedimentimonas flavescens]MCT2541265.1 restriction endonuclease subunit S [Sedimentimonas flavescens]